MNWPIAISYNDPDHLFLSMVNVYIVGISTALVCLVNKVALEALPVNSQMITSIKEYNIEVGKTGVYIAAISILGIVVGGVNYIRNMKQIKPKFDKD